jgi:hypothetical protein
VVSAHVEVTPELALEITCTLADAGSGQLDSGVIGKSVNYIYQPPVLQTAIPLTGIAAEPSGTTFSVTCSSGETGVGWGAGATITAVAVDALD